MRRTFADTLSVRQDTLSAIKDALYLLTVVSEAHPFAVSRDDRRTALARHLVPVVEELVESGTSYASLSVARIIQARGISRSAFYKYFDDKADLLVVMADDVIADLISTGAAWWALPEGGGKAELRAALSAPLGNYRERRMILGAVVEAATYDERVRAKQQWLVSEVTTALAAHIAAGQEAGNIHPDLDAGRTAKWLVWMFERGLYQEVTPASADEADLMMDAVTDLVWHALYAGCSA